FCVVYVGLAAQLQLRFLFVGGRDQSPTVVAVDILQVIEYHFWNRIFLAGANKYLQTFHIFVYSFLVMKYLSGLHQHEFMGRDKFLKALRIGMLYFTSAK